MPAIDVEMAAYDVVFMARTSGRDGGLELEGGNPIRERLMVSLKRSRARIRKDAQVMGMNSKPKRQTISQPLKEPLP